MSSWGRWKQPAPPLWYWFKRMQERAAKYGLACDFSYDEGGYQQFVEAIGPIPNGMRKPTVGRCDHDQGYILGNFRWQEGSENSRECAVRSEFARFGNEKSAASPYHNSRQEVVCPHCGKFGKLPPMKRWHFDNCREA